ncbi:threonine synthase-like 2 isoform X2 [Thalassophryne amazonica]|uniref:threonine synthase-like 2 isoform X2 n=1 Tax=Thalassophryne amazonica TaxID=390379 RepID=UPI0014717243|nr:threonine synthase-like 2 isoform X2 [Thalassophryne amazonica]
MERVFWLLLNRDGALIKNVMEEFHQPRGHMLSEKHRTVLSHILSTGTVKDDRILETMRRCWEENQYLLCPHTAVAVWHHYNCPHNPELSRCYIATASPAKFETAVQKAGLTFEPPEAIRVLDKLPSRYQNLERGANWCKDWEHRLKETIRAVGKVREKGGR